jgi:hypothetical protein
MAASYDTVARVLHVVRRHVDDRTVLKIALDLLDVPGNRSFRDTVQRLYESIPKAPGYEGLTDVDLDHLRRR